MQPQSATRTLVLIVEDEQDLADAMKARLGEEPNLSAVCVHDGNSALSVASDMKPGVILLDVNLPGRDGFSVCEELRRNPETSSTPILFVTARDMEKDEIRGFEIGADDFIAKPFRMEALLSRIRRFTRKQEATLDFEYDKLHIRITRREVLVGGKAVALTPNEFLILSELVTHIGHPVDREKLSDKIAERSGERPSSRAIDVHVASLRKKLDTYGWLVQTVRTVGYRFAEISNT